MGFVRCSVLGCGFDPIATLAMQPHRVSQERFVGAPPASVVGAHQGVPLGLLVHVCCQGRFRAAVLLPQIVNHIAS